METTTLASILEKAGLSEKAAIVYVTLLECGGAFPSHIARMANIKRSTVYGILIELSIKGLVGEVEKRGKLFYTAEHPRRLISYGARRITTAEENYETLKSVLPELEGFFSGTEHKPRVSYFEGADGVRSIYDDHIAAKKKYEMVGFVNVAELMKFLPQKEYRNYVRIKERIGIVTRGIIPDTMENRTYKKTVYAIAAAKRKTLPQVRFVSSKIFPAKGDITVYDRNKVSLITFTGKHATGIIIEDETLHDMFRMMFELAWKGAVVS